MRNSDIERCRIVGAAAHLIKPVKQSELFDAIVTSLGLLEHAEPVMDETSLPSASVRPLRVLLAEDSYTNQRMAIGVLSKWGHQVTVVNNGRDAVAAVEANSLLADVRRHMREHDD